MVPVADAIPLVEAGPLAAPVGNATTPLVTHVKDHAIKFLQKMFEQFVNCYVIIVINKSMKDLAVKFLLKMVKQYGIITKCHKSYLLGVLIKTVGNLFELKHFCSK